MDRARSNGDCKAALAFATHVGSSTTLKLDPLPAALDALDVARGKLRAAAELPTADETGKTLPFAQILPLGDGNDPLTDLEMEGAPSAHGFVAFGKTASRLVQISLVTGAAPKIGRVGSGSVRAMPDSTWGASLAAGELRAGAFDAEGAIATTVDGFKLADISSVGAAIGTLADGEGRVRRLSGNARDRSQQGRRDDRRSQRSRSTAAVRSPTSTAVP